MAISSENMGSVQTRMFGPEYRLEGSISRAPYHLVLMNRVKTSGKIFVADYNTRLTPKPNILGTMVPQGKKISVPSDKS